MAEIMGMKRLAASGDVSDAGKPVAVYGYAVESGATAAQPYFNHGVAAAQTAVGFIPGPITVSQSNVNTFDWGAMFPTGCYVSFDANTTAVTVFYSLNSVTI